MTSLPLNEETQKILIDMNAIQNKIIHKLWCAVEAGNPFAVKMARAAVIPMLKEYKDTADQLVLHTETDQCQNAPVITSVNQAPAQATEAHTVEAEWVEVSSE